jgi:hypothetical protein
MSDAPRFDPRSPEQEPRPPVVYPPRSSGLGLVGIAYMVIFTLTFTYYLAIRPHSERHRSPSCWFPPCGPSRHRRAPLPPGQGKRPAACILITAACILLALCNLAAALPAGRKLRRLKP